MNFIYQEIVSSYVCMLLQSTMSLPIDYSEILLPTIGTRELPGGKCAVKLGFGGFSGETIVDSKNSHEFIMLISILYYLEKRLSSEGKASTRWYADLGNLETGCSDDCKLQVLNASRSIGEALLTQ